MCYELVHYCLRLLSGNLVDRANSKAAEATEKTLKKKRGGSDTIKTEAVKPKKRSKAAVFAAKDDNDGSDDDDGIDEIPIKVVSYFSNNCTGTN